MPAEIAFSFASTVLFAKLEQLHKDKYKQTLENKGIGSRLMMNIIIMLHMQARLFSFALSLSPVSTLRQCSQINYVSTYYENRVREKTKKGL